MSTTSNPIRIGIILIIVALLLAATSTIGLMSQQQEERIIEKQAFSNEPVKITIVKTKKGVIKLGEKFNDEIDWFKGLTVVVENVSGKPVTYVRVGVVFPRPNGVTESYPYGDSIAYGVNPFSPEDSSRFNQAKAIAPGKSINLVMPDETYRGARVTLKSLKFPESIKRIELMVEVVGFDDGTAWSGGQLWQRDPKAPRGWSPINKQISSALNRTAKFLRIGAINSKASIFGLFHRASHSSNSQNADKIVEKGEDYKPPVKIMLVKSKIGIIEINKKISAGDDWLRGLTIRVRNDSDKSVTGIVIFIQFRRPEYQAQELDLVAPIEYGRNPFASPEQSSLTPAEPILPGQTKDVTLPDQSYDTLRSILDRENYPANIKAVKIQVRTIRFLDGTAWSTGKIFRRDPNNPDKWIR